MKKKDWKKTLSWKEWADPSTIPLNKGDDPFTQFTALVLREIRRLKYKKKINTEDLQEWILVHLQNTVMDDAYYMITLIFNSPEKIAVEVAEEYIEEINY